MRASAFVILSLIFCALVANSSCGVKGPPLPPFDSAAAMLEASPRPGASSLPTPNRRSPSPIPTPGAYQ
jgi:predicted small lipoprotein YifL